MSSEYNSLLNGVRDGELVSPAVTNRPLPQIAAQLEWLRTAFQNAQAGRCLIAYAQSCSSLLQVGTPCYLDDNDILQPALAATDSDVSQGVAAAASAKVFGICRKKLSATVADVTLLGFDEIDLGASTPNVLANTSYFLSGTTPGQLVAQQPPVSVYVLQTLRQVTGTKFLVVVNPRSTDLLDAHRHFRFELVCRPAGVTSPPVTGARHTLTSPDPDLPGWLPADHASFAGKAPPFAVYGYNLAVSPLRTLWPPLPLEGAYLEWNRGRDTEDLGGAVPLGPSGLCVIDRNGIWWMSNCYGDVPWPLSFDSTAADSFSVAPPDSVECPRSSYMSLQLYFSKPAYNTAAATVLSLTSDADGPIRVVCDGTDNEAETGHLRLIFDESRAFVDETTNLAGFAVKSLANGLFVRSPVVSGIKGSGSLVVSGTAIPDSDYVRGLVTFSQLPEFEGRELTPRVVVLNQAAESTTPPLIGISLPYNQLTGVLLEISVPDVPLPEGTEFRLRLRVGGTVASAIPANALSASYLRLPAPSALLTPVTPTTIFTSLPISTGITLTSPGQYFETESNPIEVLAGETVLVSIQRGADAYTGSLVLLRKSLVIDVPE